MQILKFEFEFVLTGICLLRRSQKKLQEDSKKTLLPWGKCKNFELGWKNYLCRRRQDCNLKVFQHASMSKFNTFKLGHSGCELQLIQRCIWKICQISVSFPYCPKPDVQKLMMATVLIIIHFRLLQNFVYIKVDGTYC